MFAAQDIRDIFRALPPQDANNGHDSLLGPPLLMTSTEEELVTTEHAFREFEHIVTTAETPQVSIKNLSNVLEVDPDVVLRFARAAPSLVLLGQDNNIIPRSQRDALENLLRGLLARELVNKTKFAREHAISQDSMKDLVESVQCHASLNEGLTLIDDFLASKPYRLLLTEAIDWILDESLRENRPAELSSKHLPGNPPLWYISQVLDSILEGNQKGSEFHISEADVISCIPKETVLRRRDATIAALQAGNVPYLDLRILLTEFSETFRSIEEVDSYLANFPEICTLGNMAISNTWLSTLSNDCAEAVRVYDYANITLKIKETFPPECHADLIDKLEKHITAAFSGESGDCQLHRVGDYLLTSVRYNTDCELLLQSAAANATHQWGKLRETPEIELKFQVADIFDFIPAEQTILRDLSDDKEIRGSVEKAFWNEIARLESENEADLSSFWATRVASRLCNYQQGLKAIEDTKLQGQLTELLFDYLKKEFIAASIAKAQSKGLVRSRKTKKQLNKLEIAMQKATDLDGLLATIDRFSKKQEVQDVDASGLASAKQVMIDDYVLWMQKRSDGPTLFLTLVVVLLARHSEGIVYATGKFAPKLMKLLKSRLGADEYAQLEKWKDMTKASSLTEEDKDRMKSWVQKVGE